MKIFELSHQHETADYSSSMGLFRTAEAAGAHVQKQLGRKVCWRACGRGTPYQAAHDAESDTSYFIHAYEMEGEAGEGGPAEVVFHDLRHEVSYQVSQHSSLELAKAFAERLAENEYGITELDWEEKPSQVRESRVYAEASLEAYGLDIRYTAAPLNIRG